MRKLTSAYVAYIVDERSDQHLYIHPRWTFIRDLQIWSGAGPYIDSSRQCACAENMKCTLSFKRLNVEKRNLPSYTYMFR